MAAKAEKQQAISISQLVATQYGVTEDWAKKMILEQDLVINHKILGSEVPKTLTTVPGVSLGQGSWEVNNASHDEVWNGMIGPMPHKIMMVNCWPNSIETEERRLFRGYWVDEMMKLCGSTSFGELLPDIYLTTYCKYFVEGKKPSIPKEEILMFRELFLQELKLVSPQLMIVCGAKTLKALFGAKATYEQYKNRTIKAADNEYGVDITVIPDVSSILHAPEQREIIAMDLNRIYKEVSATSENESEPVDYYYCYTLQDLASTVNYIKSVYSGWLSVDCEWGGPNYLDGYLRCVQFSWEKGKAAVIVFHTANKNPTDIENNKQQAWNILKDLIEDPKTRLIGHFIRADLPWLVANGVNILMPTVKGFDTALAGHLLNENWPQGLETYVARHTDLGRYEIELSDWIKANKYDVDEQGYGGIPDEILLPYAAKDADATYRIAMIQIEELNNPNNAKLKDLFEGVVMPATLPILEMEMTGIAVDRSRLELLSQKYSEKKNNLIETLRGILNWPDFNPDSPAQKAAALFNWRKKCSPPTGVTLGHYVPVKTTNGMLWENAVAKNKENSVVPSTDRSVLLQLLTVNKDCKLLNALLMFTAVNQTVKNFTGEFTETENGFALENGILSKTWSDGRVHARIRQTVETGRYGHSNPNMAQLPKTAEDLVSRAFTADEKVLSIRSCFVADPGWCIIDSDWIQAELFVMAWLSNDVAMQSKLLDKNSDFHSEVAIEMFKLDSPPENYTKGKKEWLKENGWSKFRTIAKTITFGIAYGRGAAAIKSAVGLEGVNITQEEAEDSVIKFKTTFPDLTNWLQKQQDYVDEKQFVENGFGRRRRFEPTNDAENLAHQKRQAMNAPIQGTVGDLMSLALTNLYMIREAEKPHLKYRIIMSVHDQILITCPIEQVDETLEVMRQAMCERCRIPGNDLMLDSDADVCLRWGDPISEDDVAKYPALGKYRKA
jgi:DNA polymerase I-like protein with 3'-5' exonuclease and polymerase domains/uracil-DNA glycosylase